MTWFYATSVSVNNGQNYVSVVNGDDIAIAQEGGGLIIGTNPPVEIKRTYTDGSNNKRIELAKPWPYATQTSQSAIAYPTDGDLAAATAALKGLIEGFIKATQVEAEAGTDDEHFMTALRTKQAVNSYRAFATNAAALAGAEATSVMSPLLVLRAIQQSGLLAASNAVVTDCNAVPVKTMFFSTSDTSANRPTADTKIYHGLQVAYSSQSVRQLVWCSNSGAESLYMRSGNGGPLVFTAWREIWHSGNLVKQTSAMDATAGRMLTVGAGGILGTANDVPDITAAEVNVGRLFRFINTAVGKPSFINYGSVLSLPYDGTPSTYLLGVGLRSDSSRAAFYGFKIGANATPAWIELWDKGKNPAQASFADATAGALLTARSFGIGEVAQQPPKPSDLTLSLDATTLPSGLWRAAAADTGAKPSGFTDFTFLNMRYNGSDQARLAIGLTGEAFTYASAGGVWNATGWRKLYDNLNVQGSVTHDGTKNTGAIMEYGTNSNGAYYKYADGRLECYQTRGVALTLNTDDAYTWIFPAAFISTPNYIGTVVGGASVTNSFNINKTAHVSSSASQAIMRTSVSVSQTHQLTYCAVGRWRS